MFLADAGRNPREAGLSQSTGAAFAALLLPAVHPLVRSTVGVGSHLLWIVHVLPAALLTYRFGRRAGLAVLVASPALVVAGERLFGHGYGSPATWETALALSASVGFANLLVAGFALSARRTRRTLAHSAAHDDLTGLLNRRGLRDELRDCFEAVHEEAPHTFAVVYLDLDRFARVNESLGHPVGDDLLESVAEHISGAVRPDDPVARIGGDEFVVLLRSVRDEDDALDAAERLLETVAAEPIDADGHSVVVTASAGVAVYRDAYDREDALVRDADSALGEAKRRGPGSAALFRPEMHDLVRRRLRVESELRDAIGANQLELHFQPVVRAVDERLRGVEALLRWRHPERGLVSLGQFLPVIETSDLLEPIGRWVLENARAATEAWGDSLEDDRDLVLEVNVSARQFAQPAFVEAAARASSELRERGFVLELELTEEALMEDTASTGRALERLRRAGARFAVDDFGTGYSSLRYLHELPVDTLKIDRAFVCDPDDGTCEPEIARAIVQLADSLEMETVAEGVETEFHRHQMTGLGADFLQGYWFGKPLPAEGFRQRHRATGGRQHEDLTSSASSRF